MMTPPDNIEMAAWLKPPSCDSKADQIAQPVEMEHVNIIIVGPNRREVQQAAVDELAKSMSKIGLLCPIIVRKSINPTGTFLIAGANRLAAAKQLGWLKIACFVRQDVRGGSNRDRLEEISENLHRCELSALERDDNIAEWIAITNKVSQLATPKGGAQPTDIGIRRAKRELGIDKDDASRAVKVAALSDDAKAAARESGLSNNRSALLTAAKAPKVEQASAVKAIANSKAAVKSSGLSRRAQTFAHKHGLGKNETLLQDAAAAGDSSAQVAYLKDEAERRDRELSRKSSERADAAIEKRRVATHDIAASLLEHYTPGEIPMILSWLEETSTFEIAGAMRAQMRIVSEQ